MQSKQWQWFMSYLMSSCPECSSWLTFSWPSVVRTRPQPPCHYQNWDGSFFSVFWSVMSTKEQIREQITWRFLKLSDCSSVLWRQWGSGEWEAWKGEEGCFLSDPDHFRKTPVVSGTIYYHLSSRKPPLRLSVGGGQSCQTAAGRKWRRQAGTPFIYGDDLTRRSIRRWRRSGSKSRERRRKDDRK